MMYFVHAEVCGKVWSLCYNDVMLFCLLPFLPTWSRGCFCEEEQIENDVPLSSWAIYLTNELKYPSFQVNSMWWQYVAFQKSPTNVCTYRWLKIIKKLPPSPETNQMQVVLFEDHLLSELFGVRMVLNNGDFKTVLVVMTTAVVTQSQFGQLAQNYDISAS